MRILFISSSYLGDAVLTTGVLAHLMAQYPGARFTVACGPGPADLFRANPRVDHVHVMRKKRRSGHWIDLLKEVWAQRWSMVVDLRGSATSYVLRTWRRRVLRPNHSLHRVPHIGSVLGLDPPPCPTVWLTKEAEARAAELMPDGRTVLVIGPTANWPKKMWPSERYAQFALQITAPGAPLEGADIMLQGGPGEQDQIGPIYEAIPKERLIDQVGSDLVTAAACFKRAALYVGNDSGLMHLAAAAGAPTLGLFGPTQENLYAPWGEHAAFVRGPRCLEEIEADPAFDRNSPDCAMGDLTVEAVYDAAIALLEKTTGKAGPR